LPFAKTHTIEEDWAQRATMGGDQRYKETVKAGRQMDKDHRGHSKEL
jgi:hypothetical protein